MDKNSIGMECHVLCFFLCSCHNRTSSKRKQSICRKIHYNLVSQMMHQRLMLSNFCYYLFIHCCTSFVTLGAQWLVGPLPYPKSKECWIASVTYSLACCTDLTKENP